MALNDTVQGIENSLTGVPTIAPDDLEQVAREARNIEDLKKIIDEAIRLIDSSDLPDDEKRAQRSKLEGLKNGLTGAMDLVAARARVSEAVGAANFAVTSNTIYNSLSAASQAAVNARVNALMSNDVGALINYDMKAFEHWSAADKEAIRSTLEESYNSEHSKAIHAEIAKQPKVAVQVVSERAAFRVQWLDAKIEHSQGAERELYEKLKANHVTSDHGFERIVALEKAGAPLAEIEIESDKLIQHKTEQGSQSMRRGGRQMHKMMDAYLATLPAEVADRIRGDEAAISQHITDHLKPDDIEEVNLLKSAHKPIPPELQSTEKAMMLQARFGVEARDENLLVELKEMVALKRNISQKLSNGIELSSTELDYSGNLAKINNQDLPIEKRAQVLVGTVGGRLTKSANLTNDGKLGFALLTLSYVDQHGGLEKHEEMLSRLSKSGKNDLEALQYVKDYNAYMQKKIMGETIPRSDEARAYAMQQGYELLGKSINNGTVNVATSNRELLFYKTNSDTYQWEKSFLTSREDLHIRALTSAKPSDSGIAATVKAMYEDSRAAGANPEFASIVRDIDTYRLQNDPSSEALIKDVWLGKVPLTDIRARLDEKITEEREGMQEYAGYALSRASDYQREILAKYPDFKNADGSLNMAAIMDKVENNKAVVYDYYQDYLKVPTEKLRISDDPKLQHLAEARTLSELVSPMRSAHSIEHITERSDALGLEIERITKAGGKPAQHLLDDQRLITSIMEYNPASATKQQRDEFNGAMREFLMRDAYTADKEAADAKKPEGDRSNLVANTIALVEARLTDNPLYLRQPEHHEQPNTAVTQAATPPAAASAQTPLTAAEIAARKAEGSKGELDDLGESHIEDRIKKALATIGIDKVVDAFGKYMVGANDINYNEGAQDNITVNELENALRAAARQLAGKTLSSKEVVALFDSADTNGKKDGLLSIDEIVAGLKKNGQLASVAGGVPAAVDIATSAAPSTVPQVQPTGPANPAPTTVR